MRGKKLAKAFSIVRGPFSCSGFFFGMLVISLIIRPLGNLGLLTTASGGWLILISSIIFGIIGAKICMLVSKKVKWISFILVPLIFCMFYVFFFSIAPSPGGLGYAIDGSDKVEDNVLILDYRIFPYKGRISEVHIKWNVPESLSVIKGSTDYHGGRSPFSERNFRVVFKKLDNVAWDEVKLTGQVDLVLSGHEIHHDISWDTTAGFSRISEEI